MTYSRTTKKLVNGQYTNIEGNIYSPTWTYNYINGGANNGTYLEDAYRVLKYQGAMTLANMPYNTSNYTNLTDGALSITMPVNLAKGRVSAYDNSAITYADSEMVQQYVIENTDLSNIKRHLADYNSDGAVNLLDVSRMNSDIAARNGETYAITDYIDEWGYSLADVIEEEYNMPIEQYVAENYAELSAIDAVPAELELY